MPQRIEQPYRPNPHVPEDSLRTSQFNDLPSGLKSRREAVRENMFSYAESLSQATNSNAGQKLRELAVFLGGGGGANEDAFLDLPDWYNDLVLDDTGETVSGYTREQHAEGINYLDTERANTLSRLNRYSEALESNKQNIVDLEEANNRARQEFRNLANIANAQSLQNQALSRRQLEQALTALEDERLYGLDQLALSRAQQDAEYQHGLEALDRKISDQKKLLNIANENFGLQRDSIDLQREQFQTRTEAESLRFDRLEDQLNIEQELLRTQTRATEQLGFLQQQQISNQEAQLSLTEDTLRRNQAITRTDVAGFTAQATAIQKVLGNAGNTFSDIGDTFRNQFYLIKRLSDAQGQQSKLQTRKDALDIQRSSSQVQTKSRLSQLAAKTDQISSRRRFSSKEQDLFNQANALTEEGFDIRLEALDLKQKADKIRRKSDLTSSIKAKELGEFSRQLQLSSRILSDDYQTKKYENTKAQYELQDVIKRTRIVQQAQNQIISAQTRTNNIINANEKKIENLEANTQDIEAAVEDQFTYLDAVEELKEGA